MQPYYADDAVTLYHGDCLDVLARIPDSSVDSVCTDPPYGLEFMGKDWDAPWKASGAVVRDPATERGGFQDGNGGNPYSRSRIEYGRGGDASIGFQQWCEQWATECLRVLKPGGYLVAFGGSRTWHRLAAAIEDSGFEIRDSIAWLYGSGFPKSLDVSKAIDKAAGAVREVTGRGTKGMRVQSSWDTGNGSGVFRAGADGYDETAPATEAAKRWEGWGTALKPAFEPIVVGRKPFAGTVAGNVLEHGTGALNIDGCRVGSQGGGNACPGGDKCKCVTSGVSFSPTRHPVRREGDFGRWPANVVLDKTQAAELDQQSGISVSRIGAPRGADSGSGWGMTATGAEYDDTGGASRYFPTFRYEAKAPTSERPSANGIQHPTVKPLDLMRWLVRLVTPPNGTVLEPFAGSGTTAEACIHEHMKCIAIEREADYLPVITARLTKPMQVGFNFEEGA